MGSELRISVSLRPTAVSCETVDRCIAARKRSAVFGQCRMQGRCSLFLWFAVWTMMDYCFFSACGFFDLRLCAVHLAMCVLCCDCWLCFSLCKRIFDCCLRSFALARATKRTKLKSKPSIALKNPAALKRLANFLVSGAGLWLLFT